MNTAKDTCLGCGREFFPGGYINHLRLSHDPRCGSLQNGLTPRYTLNTFASSSSPHWPTSPDIPVLDISNQSDIFSSPSRGPMHMPTDSDCSPDNNSFDNGGDNTPNNCDDDNPNTDNHMEFEDGEGCIDQLPSTVFRPPSQTTAAAVDIDTETEDSDEEEEDQQPESVSQSSHGSQDSRGPRVPNMQGWHLGSIVQ